MTDPAPPNATAAPQAVALKSDKLPLWLRLRIWASRYLYSGRSRGGSLGTIVRLPFGKVVKLNTSRNELDAMEYVRSHTSIPVPKLYEVYERPNGAVHLVMECLPGDGTDYANMSPEQIRAFGQELSGYLQQLRSLEPPEKGFIGSVTRGSLLDHRVGHVRFGPFNSVEDFHSYLRLGGPLETWTRDPVVKIIHGKSGAYRVRFTHADLNPSNIQYHNGRIVGIIDWEFAGWYPEYWEYTKMYFADRPVYNMFFDAVEGDPGIEKYPEELKAERDIWRLISPWAYDDYYEQPHNVAAVQSRKSAVNSSKTTQETRAGSSTDREVQKEGTIEPRNPED
ncbi:hypothetical protein ACRALDRAFT_1059516 [Sodiomyces alcalophilus JCM 7366]|uniref:uncharacterized protein n=1 Tax=Sodiomyces alcalophilus JCM 7366 TaxID=591952 RepID=UPI0039B57B9A